MQINLNSLRATMLSFLYPVLFVLPAAPSNGQVPTGGIVMQRDWDSSVQEGDLVVNELSELLSGLGNPARNVGPAPGLGIYRGVTYLMPLKEAVKTLGITVSVGSKNMVICPGFPHRTLVAYSFNYTFDSAFNEIFVIADRADQVVAIQLYAAAAKSTSAVNFRRDYRIYDFINSRAKSHIASSVGHSTKGGRTDTIELDSVFVDPTGKVNRMTRLFLPKPLTELILFRIGKIKANAAGR